MNSEPAAVPDRPVRTVTSAHAGSAPVGAPTDRFARGLESLRISVTDRCNFRCPYCMPAEVFGEAYRFLPRAELLTFEEIARLTRVFVGLGVSKLRLTGGEPLVRDGIETLTAQLSAIEGVRDLALTTNGSLLEEKIPALKAAGLHRVTVSLDSLDPDVFAKMNGRGFAVEKVLAAIDASLAAGLAPVKVNAVIVRGVNDAGIVGLARRYRGTGVVVRFIEYMDVGTRNDWKNEEVVPVSEILSRLHAEFPIEPIDPSEPAEVAERWRYVDGSGEIGVIGSVTRPFCGQCTRARLTTDGRLITCLFAATGPDLRGPLRAGASDADLEAIVRSVWSGRADRYSEIRAESAHPAKSKIEMFQVGG